MYNEISFPAFGITVNPPRYFQIGSLTVYFYGLIIALGLLLAVLYACRRSKEFGLKEDDILDGVLWITPFAILCARAYYVMFSWERYVEEPITALYIWEGGLAIYGGVLGAIAGVVIFCRIKKIKISALLDITALGFLIGQSIGRWGNFFNREAFGAETESLLRMGLTSAYTGSVTYYHPTFLYESVWNALGFVLLHYLSKKRRYDGQIALGYGAWYGLGRCLIEGLRMDSLWWGPFRVSQLLAAASCLGAVGILLWQMFRPHPAEDLLVHQAAALAAVPAKEAPGEEEEEQPTEVEIVEVEPTAEEPTEAEAAEE